jgi:hypothetical protein
MSAENNLKSKALYKLTIATLKVLPMIMVLGYFLMLIGFYFDSKYIVIPHLLGTVIPPLIFIYITSYVFKFCAFHRIFIHYYAFINILNTSDHYLHPYVDDNVVTFIHDGGTLVFIITAVIMYMYKYKRSLCMKILSSCGSTKVIE